MDKVERICHNVLLVADDPEAIRVIQEVLAAQGTRGVVESDVDAAMQKVEDSRWDLVLADLDKVSRGELLHAAKSFMPERPVILMGPSGSMKSAVRAMRQGCDDFLSKPLDRAELAELLTTLLPNHEVPLAAGAEQDTRCLYRMAGRSPDFLRVVKLAGKVAPTSVPVLITGESGTGKELVSYLIHRRSNRSRGPYIRVNCAALSETLLESELFGHERGAFTGAHAQRKGRFERAHGGTLLLDEISETGPRLQAELLRVLEQQDFERVGGSESVRVNVRVISTSNKDLAKEVQQGRFRRDLYYRIGGVHLVVPPLRERADDLPLLVWHFVNLYAREVRRAVKRLDERMLDVFRAYRWPGNIRQLRNVVRAALIMGEGPTLSLDGAAFLLSDLHEAPPERPTCEPGLESLSLDDLERRAILEAFARSERNQVKAARLLGITDRTLRQKLRQYRQEGHLAAVGEAL